MLLVLFASLHQRCTRQADPGVRVFLPFHWVLKKEKERKRNRKERKGKD
jgi:hypothetical protein